MMENVLSCGVEQPIKVKPITAKRVKEYMQEWMDLSAIRKETGHDEETYYYFTAVDRYKERHVYRVEKRVPEGCTDYTVSVWEAKGWEAMDYVPEQE